MRAFGTAPSTLGVASLLLLVPIAFASCETTDGAWGGSSDYYDDVGFSDPWYTGGDRWYDDDIAVPPDARPRPPPRPEHPIARPPMAGPGLRPMPSIPSRPRPSARR